jgi:phosphotransferase system HPr (HPr) family protein
LLTNKAIAAGTEPRNRIIANHEHPKTAASIRCIPLVAWPRPWPIEPPMSEGPAVARRQVEVLNVLGLHLRPALKFVELALKYQAEVRIHYNGNDFNGKSILELTSLAAEFGSRLDLEARGPDASEAVEALADLVLARFHENEKGESSESQPSGEPPS